MSLIHDALKKAQRETSEKQVQEGEFSAGKTVAPASAARAPFSPNEVTLSGINFEEKGFFQNKRNLLLVFLLLFSVVFAFYRFSGADKKSEEMKNAEVGKKANAGASASAQDEVNKLKRLAVEAYRVADLDESWAKLTAASSITSEDPEIWNNLGVVLRKRSDFDGAKKAFEKASALNTDMAEVLNNLAVLDIKANDLPSAQGRLAKALQLKPNFSEAIFHMGLVADLSGDKRKASEHYKQFLATATTMPPHILDQVRDHIINLEK